MAHPSPTVPAQQRLGQRAAVIGASMAGLLAARVLSEHYDEVVLLERDELPEQAGPRKGTPHAQQPHGLLARGCQVLEHLFPGFTAALLAQGAEQADLQSEVALDAAFRRFESSPSGLRGLGASRLAIEAELRRRVRALPGVRLLTGVDVVAPLLAEAGGRVTGVRYLLRAVDEGEPRAAQGQSLDADLTLDCSGRGSRSAAWLQSWGFAPPPEERVDVGIAYVSAYFRRDGAMARGGAMDKAAIIHSSTPELPLPGVLIAQEPGADGVPRWALGVGGYAGNHPATSLQGMQQRAAEMGVEQMSRLAREGTPLGEPARYVFPYSLRRRYERLKRFPQGYLVMGDALTSFNPVYGQGMTVAACQALALSEVLRQGLPRLSERFFRAASRVVDTPWQLAVGNDLSIPSVPGPRPLPVRVVNAYVARLMRVAVHDAVVARAFLEVLHLLKEPPSLFAPGILWRVLRLGAASTRAAPADAGQPVHAGPV